jgi:eukaryotic-like serine/threonine-protein kinase
MIGERIGHLRVIGSIGVGGMGAVWHAVDELLDRHVALKVIRPELLSRPGLAERFRSEAIVLARLQHPCIAALYGLDKRGDEFVMVMEYVDGQTLDSLLVQQNTLPWPEASRITRAILDALDHAHESGVVHRDIKPANVMLTRAGRVKVMDFGIARLVGAQRQTRTGAAVGTPSYMSPEQLLGQEVDGRADVYAVGTLLYELCTGHLPFEVEGDYLRMIAQLQEVPKPPSTHNASLPPGLDTIVARALEKEQGDRYATAGEFRDALEALERSLGVWRPYGTPSAGSVTITGSTPAVPGTPAAGVAAARSDATPTFRPNSSALLTPVESAMSLTPVPFSVEPAGATPIDLSVPAEFVGASAAAAPEPAAEVAQAPAAFAAPMAEMPDRAVTSAPAARKRTRPYAAVAAVVVGVAVAVVKFSGGGNADAPPSSAPIAAVTAPAPSAPPVVAAPVPLPAVVSADSSADSAAIRKALADSARAARRARADSLKAARDSAAKAALATTFALPGSGGPSEAELRSGREAGRRAAEECVAALNAHEMGRLESLFGGDRKNVLRIARDGKLDANGPLNPQYETDQADRVTTRFTVLLQWKNGNNEDRTARANLRALAERRNGAWTSRCLVDSDGGARF